MATITLPDYDVRVEPGVLDDAGAAIRAVAAAHRYVIITDTNVGPIYAARLADALGSTGVVELRAPAGEGSKSRERWSALTDRMLDAGCGRDTTVIALGGGVIGDLAGFVAATFMRGVPVVQIPTSLLAMVDASVGGKTGVDTPAGKNLVGAFHQPAMVLVDPRVLASLPAAELRAGAAEILKHGAIADAEHFEEARRALPRLLGDASDDGWTPLIARSIEIKASVVRRDPRERDLRKILNFGHTLGHAIESATDFRLRHGHAVAIGMVLESRLAERIGVAESGTAARILEGVRAAELPTERPADVERRRLVDATHSDKKSRRGHTEYALPARVGEMAAGDGGWTIRVSDQMVLEILE
ncbi:MAG TPA: 3-dehydroquinate synthase [Gemmatimonadaceae bacterium]|nr:3-dehydroquinate synthase [Gemmatimonadaceae bacterium]